MTVELGHLALWLALATATLLAVLPLWGERHGRREWLALADPLTGLTAALVAASYAALTAAFVAPDFSVAYVAQHANSELPLAYRVAAVWGGHEGSLLLWVLLLVGWALALRHHGRRHLPPRLLARSLAVLGALTAALLGFLLTTSNPFERVLPALPEGRDLNPLLQDPGMVLHPPMLYMGYVGFAVVYALAMAALLAPPAAAGYHAATAGDHAAEAGFSPAFARQLRPWATAAWACLTLGIALGSWWAYYELGWGGWWFWDPVENASFMPWLAGTALLHSLAVVDKRGAFRAWAVGLAILAFSLSLLGTFLVRSGVLSSVHAFATDPRRGLYILLLLVAVVGASVAVYAARAHRLGLGARFHWRSRETSLLANNLLLMAACGAVLLGTLYPLALDALSGQKISVGPPYFEAVFVPLMAPLLLLLGVGPLLRWRQDEPRAIARALRWPLLLAPLGTLAHAWAQGAWPFVTTAPGGGWAAMAGLLAAWWVGITVVADLAGRVAPRQGEGLAGSWQRLRSLPRSVVAMALAHGGVAVFIVGVTSVSSWQVEQDLVLAPGGQAQVAGWQVQLQSLRQIEGPNYQAVRATVVLLQGGRSVATLQPEKRLYRSSEMPMTEAGIAPGLLRDLYVSLAEPVQDPASPPGAWLLRVAVKPAVNWIWGGCVLMALGGLLAASDRRYRRAPSTHGNHHPHGAFSTPPTTAQVEATPVASPTGASGAPTWA
jgi:cytochrome c-type biogenesis protein CcmF